ncbi:uncharacterized protein smtna isoform X3 [Stegastes partitus]|uniref:Uncharacterized protein smtna isoform X3 n=1 Tax=Stegastes partitus TaxID=144197 RepID=A0A9Y4NGR8_9TELE|nr:PREDICTED: uncharacterized protein LOC103369933 isoform X3 [Stegastes partitus]
MESKPDGAASLSCEELAAVEDEEVLNKMLDNATDFEERRMIRAALRDLLKKKRDKREQDRGSRQQDLRQQGLSKGGTTGGGVSVGRASMNQQPTTNSESDLLRDHILLSVSILYFHFIPSIFSEAPGQSSASGPFNRTAGGPVPLQPSNVLLLQHPTLKMSNRCFWTGAGPKQSLMRGWTSRTSPPAGKTASPSAPWCTGSSPTRLSTPSSTPTSTRKTSSWPSALQRGWRAAPLCWTLTTWSG